MSARPARVSAARTMSDPDVTPAPPDREAILLQRARVLEHVAGSAWHELAQSLGGLHGFVTMLQLDGWTAAQLGVDPQLARDAAVAAERLAHTFTDLARGGPRAVHLRDLVENHVALAGHLLVDVAVEIAIPTDVPEPELEPAPLGLVVASLVADAVTAMGGPRAARGRMRWSARDRGDAMLEVVVEDSGATATPGDIALLTAIVASAGGTLGHEALPDGGNRIVLAVPVRRSEEPPPPAVPAVPPEPQASARLTVLVCDDDPAVREVLAHHLERGGLHAIAATSAAEALAVIDREPVDVVLTDHRMAGMTGRQLQAAVRARRPDLARRVVLMSGDAGDAELLAFAAAEGLVVLAKPFDYPTLVPTLREAAGR